MQIYQPAEDSHLLARNISKYSRGLVLDIGTGTGILAAEASQKAEKVIAIDINKEAIKQGKKTYKNLKNLEFRQSNLFEKIKSDEKFNLIIFNPPYLPNDKEFYDPALHGGKKGYEVIEKFLKQASKYLKPNGKILLLISTQTKPKKVQEIIDKYGFEYKKIDEESLFFEKLFVYEIKKTKILKEIEKQEVEKVEKFTRGKRGIIYTGKLNKKKIAIKVQKKTNKNNTIKNEIEKLKILNEKNIGPKIIFSGENYFGYEFIEGIFIEEFLEKSSKKTIKKILKQVFEQLKILDDMHLNKEEMHNPFKHIIIDKKNNAYLVDFERCKETTNRKNITQFVQYLTTEKIRKILEKKGFSINPEKLRKLAQDYKETYGDYDYGKLIKEIME